MFAEGVFIACTRSVSDAVTNHAADRCLDASGSASIRRLALAMHRHRFGAAQKLTISTGVDVNRTRCRDLLPIQGWGPLLRMTICFHAFNAGQHFAAIPNERRPRHLPRHDIHPARDRAVDGAWSARRNGGSCAQDWRLGRHRCRRLHPIDGGVSADGWSIAVVTNQE